MLKRYHIIALDDLRAAAAKGDAYTGESAKIVALASGTRRVNRFEACVAEL